MKPSAMPSGDRSAVARVTTYRRVHVVERTGGSVAYMALLRVDGRARSIGTWVDAREAEIATDRAALHLGIDVELKEPAESRRRGPASIEELQRLARLASPKRKGSSGFFGVVRARDGRFHAQVCPGGRRTVSIGTFDDEEVAALVYDRVARATFGVDARLNFPERQAKPATIEEIRREYGLRLPEDKASHYVGISWVPRRKKWHASITVDKRTWSLGQWADEGDAARTYDRAALHFHGVGARRNFPDERASPASPDEIQAEQYSRRRRSMTSRYEGVCRHDQGWLAYVDLDGVRHNVCVYPREIDAAIAHDRVRLYLEGSEARRNFPALALAPASIEELRRARRAEIKRTKTSAFEGVSYLARTKKWQAAIESGGQKACLGHFEDEKEAALAYDRAALHLHGSSAKLNFPERRTRPATADEIHIERWQQYKEETTSRYTGVHWHAMTEKWLAQIVVDGARILLGSYDDEVAAARAYDCAAREHRGDDQLPQWVNFPEASDGEMIRPERDSPIPKRRRSSSR